jgi:S1-C subfamily serine protease
MGIHVTASEASKGAVEVSLVQPGSPAEAAGLRVQDNLTEANGLKLRADPDIHAAVAVLKTLPASFDLTVQRPAIETTQVIMH